MTAVHAFGSGRIVTTLCAVSCAHMCTWEGRGMF